MLAAGKRNTQLQSCTVYGCSAQKVIMVNIQSVFLLVGITETWGRWSGVDDESKGFLMYMILWTMIILVSISSCQE